MGKRLSKEEVKALRADRQANGTSYRKLAERYGICRGTVGSILRNQNAYRLGECESPSGVQFRPVPVYVCRGCEGARVDTWPCPACLARNGKHTSG